jgi:creatinine amidohydrolase/Fe(II)-dependent formamide hydrolase-like protein
MLPLCHVENAMKSSLVPLRIGFLSVLLVLCLGGARAVHGQAASPDPDAPRPIDALDSVFMEELTWMEVRDALRSGMTTAIIATGGVEQNGPYLATGKHNVILRATTEAIARELGNALVAPIVPFVPEGEIDPPGGHMRYPGTISVSEETFRALLTDLARSLEAHGFRHLILLGDSGGNQDGMAAVASALGQGWGRSETTIHFIPEYYDNPRWAEWLASRGVNEVDEGLHDDVRHSAIMLLVDPTTVRMEQRRKAGLFSINGVELDPVDETLELARSLVGFQAEVTAEAIRRAISEAEHGG